MNSNIIIDGDTTTPLIEAMEDQCQNTKGQDSEPVRPVKDIKTALTAAASVVNTATLPETVSNVAVQASFL